MRSFNVYAGCCSALRFAVIEMIESSAPRTPSNGFQTRAWSSAISQHIHESSVSRPNVNNDRSVPIDRWLFTNHSSIYCRTSEELAVLDLHRRHRKGQNGTHLLRHHLPFPWRTKTARSEVKVAGH